MERFVSDVVGTGLGLYFVAHVPEKRLVLRECRTRRDALDQCMAQSGAPAEASTHPAVMFGDKHVF